MYSVLKMLVRIVPQVHHVALRQHSALAVGIARWCVRRVVVHTSTVVQFPGELFHVG